MKNRPRVASLVLTALVACSRAPTAMPEAPLGTLEGCPAYALYGRLEMKPRSPAFDAAARAFDAALADHRADRHLEAARKFMIAAGDFLVAGDVQDRRWSYENAASEWAIANRLDEARIALERAEADDPELATEIRNLRDHLPEPCAT